MIKPIGQVLDPILVLDLQVLKMGLGYLFRGRTLHIVAIHEDRHF